MFHPHPKFEICHHTAVLLSDTTMADHYERSLSQSCPVTVPNISESELVDPPPPYPEQHSGRRHHTRAPRDHHHSVPAGQGCTHHNEEVQFYDPLSYYPEDNEAEANEDTPFLIPGQSRHPQTRHWRHHAPSQTSSTSTTMSLTRTLVSLFQEDESEVASACIGDCADAHRHRQHQSLEETTIVDELPSVISSPHECLCSCSGILSRITWERYFRPMRRWEYYKALFHLLVLNFPYALFAWVYLFAFTVVRSLQNSAFVRNWRLETDRNNPLDRSPSWRTSAIF